MDIQRPGRGSNLRYASGYGEKLPIWRKEPSGGSRQARNHHAHRRHLGPGRRRVPLQEVVADTEGYDFDDAQAFTGNAGNKRKVLIGGSGLIELLNQMEQTKVVMAGENIVKWGIDFSEMHSKFGKLYILLSEVFDECGMEYNGMIIDPEYLQKYSHIPFTTEQLNLKQAGVRNTDALVLTEASCMTLRYPKAHLRIIGE